MSASILVTNLNSALLGDSSLLHHQCHEAEVADVSFPLLFIFPPFLSVLMGSDLLALWVPLVTQRETVKMRGQRHHKQVSDGTSL